MEKQNVEFIADQRAGQPWQLHGGAHHLEPGQRYDVEQQQRHGAEHQRRDGGQQQ